jgi:hypothetical protein
MSYDWNKQYKGFTHKAWYDLAVNNPLASEEDKRKSRISSVQTFPPQIPSPISDFWVALNLDSFKNKGFDITQDIQNIIALITGTLAQQVGPKAAIAGVAIGTGLGSFTLGMAITLLIDNYMRQKRTEKRLAKN